MDLARSSSRSCFSEAARGPKKKRHGVWYVTFATSTIAEDVRDLLGDNLPVIVRPALLAALEEIERQVHRGFDKLEHDLERL